MLPHVTRQAGYAIDRLERAATRGVSRRAMLGGMGLLGASIAGLLLGGCQLVSPPAATKAAVRRIGYLSGGTRAVGQPYADAFLDRLRQLGWVEGENLTIEWRFAEGNYERMPELAAELLQPPVEVIVAAGASAGLPARQTTSTIGSLAVEWGCGEAVVVAN